MTPEPVSAAAFARAGLTVLNRLAEQALPEVARAARLIADCVAGDGVVQAFGTDHSQAMVLEVAGRAGGLVPTNRIAISDLVQYGGGPAAVLDDPLLERRPGVAARLFQLAAPRAGDLFVIVSKSGVNSVVVEMALLAKEHGHPVVAVTSLTHSRAVPAAHPAGRKLADLADVVLDNATPRGDALLPLEPQGAAVGAVSTLSGALLVQMAVVEAIGLLRAEGRPAPVYISANVPGGFEDNLRLERHYLGRIRRTAG